MGFVTRAAVHSWGPLTDSRAHAQMQPPNQRGQMENHGLEEYAAFQLTNVLTLSFHLLPVNPFLMINANSASHQPKLCPYTQYYLPTKSIVNAYYGSNLLTSRTDGVGRKLKVSLLNLVSHSEPYSNALVSCPYSQLAGEVLGWELPENFFIPVQHLVYFLQLCGETVNPTPRMHALGYHQRLNKTHKLIISKAGVTWGAGHVAFPPVAAQATEAWSSRWGGTSVRDHL